MNRLPAKPGKTTGHTVRNDDEGNREPRLPHESDESHDSQHSEPRQVIRQAYEDVQSQEDTDLRGTRGERVPAVPRNES